MAGDLEQTSRDPRNPLRLRGMDERHQGHNDVQETRLGPHQFQNSCEQIRASLGEAGSGELKKPPDTGGFLETAVL